MYCYHAIHARRPYRQSKEDYVFTTLEQVLADFEHDVKEWS